MRRTPASQHAGAVLRGALTSVLLSGLAACGGTASQDGGAPDPETFIATYVDLRATALRFGDELTDSARGQVLARHGVDADALLRFVDVHGSDVEFMKGIWDEVEARLDATRILEPTQDSLPER